MPRFTLQPRTWYAMECIFPSGDRHHSPIWIEEITPLQSGQGRLRIRFYHANYPEGVRDKTTTLQVFLRNPGNLLAFQVDDTTGQPTPTQVILEPITEDWLRQHVLNLDVQLGPDLSLAEVLDRLSGRVPSR